MNASLFYCAACGAFVVFALSLLGPNEVLLPGIVEATVSAVRFAFEKKPLSIERRREYLSEIELDVGYPPMCWTLAKPGLESS